MRRTARSDHTTGGEWRCLFATHANPSDSTEAINRMSVSHPALYRHPSRAQHLGLARTLKPKIYSAGIRVRVGSHLTREVRSGLTGSFP